MKISIFIILALALMVPMATRAEGCLPEPLFIQKQTETNFKIEQGVARIDVIFEQPFESIVFLGIEAPYGYRNLTQSNEGFTAQIPRLDIYSEQSISVNYFVFGYACKVNAHRVMLPMMIR